MDRETERLLNLYLDDQLTGADRQAFEIRLKQDSELRKAVDLHRETAAELRRMPELPEGFAVRARARLDRALPQKTAGWTGKRFWSLETAGLLAAAGIVVAVLYPFLKPNETGQFFTPESRSESPLPTVAEKAVEEPGPGAGDRIPEREALQQPTSPDDDRQNKALATSAPPRTEPPAEPSTEEDQSREDIRTSFNDESIEGLPAFGREYNDVITTTPAVPKAAEAPAKERVAKDPDRSPPVAAFAESVAGAMAALEDQDAGTAIPFRVVQAPGTAELGKRSFVSLKKEADFDLLKRDDPAEELQETGRLKILTIDQAREGFPLGIDLKKEMGVLVAARRQGDPPVRIEVTGARRAESRILIQYREIPVPADDASWRLLADYQVVILPASELPIELQKID